MRGEKQINLTHGIHFMTELFVYLGILMYIRSQKNI